MSAARYRVWVEELQPPAVLRFSWHLPEDHALDVEAASDLVRDAVAARDGVISAEPAEGDLVVEIDPSAISRYDLAAVIRATLEPDDSAPDVDEAHVRVWAEDLSKTEMRITWETPPGDRNDADRQQRRRVAAWLSVFAGVKAASLDDEGVLVRYSPEDLDRSRLGDDVRTALDDDIPLRERADELLKRATTYGNLARKLAMDDRISPLPGAAKQAVAARAGGRGGGNVAVRTASRFVPGAALITRIQTLLPLLTELSQWSREADPEVVESHLASVGLDRATLRRDTITAHEIRYFARDSAAEHASALGERASAGARQALAAGREMFASVKEALDEKGEQSGDAAKSDADASGTGHDETTPLKDGSPEDRP